MVRPISFFAKYWSLIKTSQDQARNLLELPLSSQNKEIIENFVTIMDAPFRERLARIRKYGYRKKIELSHNCVYDIDSTKFAYRGEKDVRLFLVRKIVFCYEKWLKPISNCAIKVV